MPRAFEEVFLEFHQIVYLVLKRPIWNWGKSLNHSISTIVSIVSESDITLHLKNEAERITLHKKTSRL